LLLLMKRLIVNADDFGFTRGVNAGIVRAYKTGIVTSTTIMANGEAFEDAIELVRTNPGLGVGCHLAVVGGRPVAEPSQVRSLVDDEGALPATLTQLMIKLARGSVSTDEIAREFRSQIERVARAGIEPTHLDTHKHSHTHPQVMKALARVAAEFGIKCVRNPFEGVFAPARLSSLSKWAYLKQYAMSAAIQPGAIKFKRLVREHGLRTPDRFFGVGLTGMLDSAAIRSMMESLGEGTAELMCHPGAYDDDLERAHTRLKRERERELEALSDPSLRRLAEEQGIELISYGEL
jgi:hopanoid biosynthesis associated protein HpnK